MNAAPWCSAALLLGCLGALGCVESARPRSILLVTLDTTRADRLGCYGRAAAGTPVLDALAARGARFERAYTTAPITLPAHASILSGSPPPHHGLRDNGLAALDEGVETLAEVARRAGRRTAACVSGFPLSHLFGLAQGFEFYGDDFGGAHGAREGVIQERRADATVREAGDWLARLAPDESFFLWVHLFDAHDPYQPPAEFAQRFAADPYQGEIAYTDQQLGVLLAQLDALGRTADTVVLVTADHGEALGEHGEATHALLLYEATVHVPLLLAGPDVPARVVPTPVSHVDLAATLVELAGIDDGGAFSRHGGRSLAPLARGDAAGFAARPLYLETYFPRLHYGWSELVGLARDEWKYVAAPGARGADGRARAELFSPASDPLERSARADAQPAQELADVLHALRAELEASAAPLTRHVATADEMDALAALGYGGMDVLAELPSASADSPSAQDPRLVVEAVPLLSAIRAQAGAGQFEAAERALARLEALAPGGIVLHEARGDFHLARGRAGSRTDLERAADEFAAATALKPGRRGLWLRRSEALQQLGRLAEALECIDHALELAPPTPQFLEAREALKKRVETGR